MNILIDDVIIYIMNFLSDKDKINYLSSSKYLDKIKIVVHYDTLMTTNKIKELPYYDMFTNIFVENTNDKLPKSVNKFAFDCLFNEDIKGYIPLTVIDLCLGWDFNRSIKDCIPTSIKYLS